MSRKAIKAITIISLLFIILININYAIFASSMDDFNPSTYQPTTQTSTSGTGKIQTIANKVIGPIRIIGSMLSIVMLVVMGIKYIIGSVEERAEYKKTMKPYLIGAIMVFGITNLLGVLIGIISKINANV